MNASKRALERADKALSEAVAVRDEAQAGLDEAAAELDAAESEARQLGEEASQARKRAAACDVEAKKATHTAQRLKTEAASAARRVESLTEKHTWIPHEKGFFGCAGGDYDFAAREGGAARARADLDKLERAQDKLARKINKRVMGMIEKSERDYDDLTAKKATVARDRSKIEAVISELEVKKQETLEVPTRRLYFSTMASSGESPRGPATASFPRRPRGRKSIGTLGRSFLPYCPGRTPSWSRPKVLPQC